MILYKKSSLTKLDLLNRAAHTAFPGKVCKEEVTTGKKKKKIIKSPSSKIFKITAAKY